MLVEENNELVVFSSNGPAQYPTFFRQVGILLGFIFLFKWAREVEHLFKTEHSTGLASLEWSIHYMPS